MVTIISVGIENGGGLERIPCAYKDAERIYAMFEKALGDNMKKVPVYV